MNKDKKIYFETEQGQKLFVYQTEDCDMQKELTETIDFLQSRLEQKDNAIDECIKYLEKFIPIGEDTILMRESQRDYILEKLQQVKGNKNE